MNQDAINWICMTYGCFNPRAHEDDYKAFVAGQKFGLEQAVKAAKDARCGSNTPWDCGCDPGIKAIEKKLETVACVAHGKTELVYETKSR